MILIKLLKIMNILTLSSNTTDITSCVSPPFNGLEHFYHGPIYRLLKYRLNTITIHIIKTFHSGYLIILPFVLCSKIVVTAYIISLTLSTSPVLLRPLWFLPTLQLLCQFRGRYEQEIRFTDMTIIVMLLQLLILTWQFISDLLVTPRVRD